MQLKLFIVPVKNLSVPEGEMNAFLRAHRVLAASEGGSMTASPAKSRIKSPTSTSLNWRTLLDPASCT